MLLLGISDRYADGDVVTDFVLPISRAQKLMYKTREYTDHHAEQRSVREACRVVPTAHGQI